MSVYLQEMGIIPILDSIDMLIIETLFYRSFSTFCYLLQHLRLDDYKISLTTNTLTFIFTHMI